MSQPSMLFPENQASNIMVPTPQHASSSLFFLFAFAAILTRALAILMLIELLYECGFCLC
jgi:hypothetical protein